MDLGQGGVAKSQELQVCHTFACSQLTSQRRESRWEGVLREPEAATGFAHM